MKNDVLAFAEHVSEYIVSFMINSVPHTANVDWIFCQQMTIARPIQLLYKPIPTLLPGLG